MADDDSDKTEAPTGKKLMEARQEGRVGKSQDLNAAVLLLIAILFLYLLGYQLVKLHVDAVNMIFSQISDIELIPSNVGGQAVSAFEFVMAGILPFMLVMMVAAILVNISQIGILFTLKPITPDFSKIDPIKGLKSKFTLRQLMVGIMNILKFALMGSVSYLVISSEWNTVFRMAGQDLRGSLMVFAAIFFKLAFILLIVLFVLGIFDFIYQKWQIYKNLMMTKQEVKDELKNYEGDPKIKQKRRQIQMQMSRQRMMRDVQDADVVITNPTHYSVALKYDEEVMRAPVVVAKGVDLLALRIREIADEFNIPKVENKSLARALYTSTEVGEPVPTRLYKAVAEILAYVYSLRNNEANAS